jgi:hypothetical protein
MTDLSRSAEVIVEMANFRSQETGLHYSLHVRSKEETLRTSHSEIPTLKVYADRPGLSEFFSMTISKSPEVVEAHKDRQFTKSVSAKDLAHIRSWIVKNEARLMDFWDHGGTWFQDETDAWKTSLEKV